MLRSRPLEETVKLSKKFLMAQGLRWKEITADIDGLNICFVSDIDFENDEELNKIVIKGKGDSELGSKASLYGEAIERLSWLKGDDHLPIYDIYKGEKVNANRALVGAGLFNHTGMCAAGNTVTEALTHALYEMWELSFAEVTSFPLDAWVYNTETEFPDWPQHVHDSFVCMVKRDPRFPLYTCHTLKYPTESEQNRAGYYNAKDGLEYVDETEEQIYWATSGQRVGRSVESIIRIAMGENFQQLTADNFKDAHFPEGKKRKQKELPEVSSPSFEVNSIQEDCDELIRLAKPYCNFLGYRDLTMEGSPLSVVQILTDFNMSPNFDAKLNQDLFFDLK